MILPTERNMSTKVIPHVIFETAAVVPKKSTASWVVVKETVKKSKASHDHAKKATRKNSHCWVLSIRSSVNGFGALFMGGLRVEILVAIYRPALIVVGAYVGDPSRNFSSR